MESMCGIHGPQRRLSERQLPLAPHRLDCRHFGRARYVILSGCLLEIPLDPHAPPGCGKNIVHHSPWTLLLQCDAFRLKECRGHLSEVGDEDVSPVTK